MLAYLYERRESLLRTGLALAMLPHGKIYGIMPPRGRVGSDYYEMQRSGVKPDLSVTLPRDEQLGNAPRPFRSGYAHLSFGFRTARSMHTHSSVLPVIGSNPSSIPNPEWSASGSFPEIPPMKFTVPRRGFDQHGVDTFLEGIVPQVLSYEDAMCSRELSKFCFYNEDYAVEDGHTLFDLHRFVKGLNRSYTSFMRLDTVFLNSVSFSQLAGGSNGTPVEGTGDAVDYRGLRVIGHEHVSPDEMLAMSHTHGPVFVNGPTTLVCGEDEFIVGRYCQIASPRGGLSGRTPYGIRAGMRPG